MAEWSYFISLAKDHGISDGISRIINSQVCVTLQCTSQRQPVVIKQRLLPGFPVTHAYELTIPDLDSCTSSSPRYLFLSLWSHLARSLSSVPPDRDPGLQRPALRSPAVPLRTLLLLHPWLLLFLLLRKIFSKPTFSLDAGEQSCSRLLRTVTEPFHTFVLLEVKLISKDGKTTENRLDKGSGIKHTCNRVFQQNILVGVITHIHAGIHIFIQSKKNEPCKRSIFFTGLCLDVSLPDL